MSKLVTSYNGHSVGKLNYYDWDAVLLVFSCDNWVNQSSEGAVTVVTVSLCSYVVSSELWLDCDWVKSKRQKSI